LIIKREIVAKVEIIEAGARVETGLQGLVKEVARGVVGVKMLQRDTLAGVAVDHKVGKVNNFPCNGERYLLNVMGISEGNEGFVQVEFSLAIV